MNNSPFLLLGEDKLHQIFYNSMQLPLNEQEHDNVFYRAKLDAIVWIVIHRRLFGQLERQLTNCIKQKRLRNL